MKQIIPLPASYRDNAGFVFEHKHKIYRIINKIYFPHYQQLLKSGLYNQLTAAGRLIKHEDVNNSIFFKENNEDVKIILPEQLPFISYPYEWSFNMYKDAAIVTLKILQVALQNEMILKDATPFNIQFSNGRPVFIDTLSFEIYEEGKPWIAYRQFCECFLSPLLLMQYGHRDLGKLMRVYPDGIPLEVTKSLLPLKSRLSIHVYLHIFLQYKIASKSKKKEKVPSFFSKEKLLILVKGLLDFITTLNPRRQKSTWDDYYTDTILGNDYLLAKQKMVVSFCELISFKTVIDLGANDGCFCMLLQKKAENIISVDFDSNCVNELYKKIRQEKILNIVPLVATLNMPSPAIGWANKERTSLTRRLKADLILALALLHHLVISNNVPLAKIADWFAKMGANLIIEFIPKSDEKVKHLLLNRTDIFFDYDIDNFKNAFEVYYNILEEQKVKDTERVLFLMQRK